MKIVDFTEKLAERKGELTPRALIEDILEHIDDVDKIVVTIRLKDEEVRNAFSHMNFTEAIGLFELGKFLTVGDMYGQ